MKRTNKSQESRRASFHPGHRTLKEIRESKGRKKTTRIPATAIIPLITQCEIQQALKQLEALKSK